MSGLFPAGSEEGEEERTGEENRRGGMPARARFIPGGSSKGRSSRLHQAVRQKACPSVQTHRRLIRTDGTDVHGVLSPLVCTVMRPLEFRHLCFFAEV